MTKAALEASISLLEKCGIFFGILVAIGVTGESVIGFKLWWRNRDLKAVQEHEIADLAEKAAVANKKAAELGLAVEAEKRARLEIERASAWRSLDEEQQLEIASGCRRFASLTVFIRSYPNDGEAWALGRQIAAVLRSIHIDVQDRLGQALARSAPVFGIVVSGPVRSLTQPSEAEFVQVLAQSLRVNGKLASVVLELEPFDSPAEITVGLRPPVRIKTPDETTAP